MKRGHDGIWRTVGGIAVSERQQVELSAPSTRPADETIHVLFVVNPKSPLRPIEEVKCRIVITGKRTWAEPIMPLRGAARHQKRLMLGAFAFYTRQQAERKKLIMIAQSMKAPSFGQTFTIHNEACKQYEQYKLTGEVK